MLQDRKCFVSVAALALIACSAEDPAWQDPGAATDTVSEAARWRRPRSTTQVTSSSELVQRRTSDNEVIDVVVPEPAPTLEVPAGGTCGVRNAQGVELVCAPGAICISAASGTPGTCQAGPRAPISDG